MECSCRAVPLGHIHYGEPLRLNKQHVPSSAIMEPQDTLTCHVFQVRRREISVASPISIKKRSRSTPTLLYQNTRGIASPPAAPQHTKLVSDSQGRGRHLTYKCTAHKRFRVPIHACCLPKFSVDSVSIKLPRLVHLRQVIPTPIVRTRTP